MLSTCIVIDFVIASVRITASCAVSLVALAYRGGLVVIVIKFTKIRI